MKKTVKLTESDLNRIVKKVLIEQDIEDANYMFFSNLQQMKRQIEMIMEMDKEVVNEIIINGHDWADDHISEAKTNIDQVFDFLKNEMDEESQYVDYEDINEGIKKNVATNQKLWKQSLEWAKSRYKVCPSAYCNGAAVKRYNSKGGKWRKK
jgi:nitrogen fixation/metabolism regulation signal transduction histidine kinase